MNYRYSDRLGRFSSSAVREILKLTQRQSVISFAGGLPAEEHFPVAAVGEAFRRVLEEGNKALQYGLTEGYLPLRESICRRMAAKGITVTPDDMLLTTGSQQAIDLLVRIYIDPGDVILVERPTYLSAIQVFNFYGAKLVSVNGDEDGMDLADLAAKLKQHRPKMAYVIPTFSNPTGKAWSLERRQGVLDLCRQHDVLILEDDPYGELKFGDESVTYPSLFSLDRHPASSSVVYTSTFSKTVAPALRTGWVMGDPDLIRNMARAKQAADLHSSSLDQQTLYQLMEHFDLDGHISFVRKEYEVRMRQMLGLLQEQKWPGVAWQEPKGGMFFWLELPERIDAAELLKTAVSLGVAFVPGGTFFAENPKANTMRLNFTHNDTENTIKGMSRLSQAMDSVLVR
ncbi:aminotransferase class I/II-fold pyridoxal phosphate-dependent enzyme [Cohnella sp. CFH 77786]|uniref:aminotransferase-like domain-containing protein n=1 Tax=Cohnella sp. CFH 77786 TaxID=2662265 RepID=UPI001C60F8D7|nr:PLP-dependent aminotransferase family protein [Cohnella sp. CFH 77786]MBW5446997.1 aminotransferase class I/II-fold pyridoxal phosphate-dependent enzyme [Cohnella sp. CFH 77786]